MERICLGWLKQLEPSGQRIYVYLQPFMVGISVFCLQYCTFTANLFLVLFFYQQPGEPSQKLVVIISLFQLGTIRSKNLYFLHMKKLTIWKSKLCSSMNCFFIFIFFIWLVHQSEKYKRFDQNIKPEPTL